MAGKSSKPKQVMDVSRPGARANSPTSRPIIVTNRPVLKDPMVVEGDAETKESAERKAPTTTSKVKIEPLHDDLKPEPAADQAAADTLPDAPVLPVEEVGESKADKPEEPAAAEPPADKTAPEEEAEKPEETEEPEEPAEPAAEAEEPSEPDKPAPAETETAEASDSLPGDDDEPSAQEAADHDAQLADLGKPDPEAAKAAREAAEKQLALDKLVAEETYFLPIDRSGKRRMQRMLLVVGLVLFVLLALVAVDLLLDAGLISLGGIEAPTDFIYNK